MSGSSGGGSGSWSDPPSNCATLVVDTQLSSPKQSVIVGIAVGDVLDVATQDVNGTTTVVVLRMGQVAGGLASPQAPRLRECIAEGYQYQATVTDVQGGQIRVRVASV